MVRIADNVVLCRLASWGANGTSLWGRAGIAVVREKIRQGSICGRLCCLAPPSHHHRHDGRFGASADRGQRCRLVVGYLKKLTKAWQIANPRHVAKASLPGKACRFAKTPHREAGRPGPGCLETLRFETGRREMRSLEIPGRSGCGTYRRVGRRDQCPQRRRVRLQSASCAADRGEIEGRWLS